MSRIALVTLTLLVLQTMPVSAQVSAEPWFRGGTLMMTVEVGGASFTDFQRGQAQPLDASLGISRFERRVSAQTAGSVGAWVEYWVLNGVGVRAAASYTPTRFAVWNADPARELLDRISPDQADPSYAALDVWMAHAAAVFRIPHSFGRVSPYVIAGAGVIRYAASSDAAVPAEARSAFAEQSRDGLAGVMGVGAAIPLQRRNLLMSFELTNYLARSPLPDGAAGEPFVLAGVPMQLDARRGDGEVGMTSHLRLAIGLTLPVR